jgi:hypothetical protein
MKTNPWWLAARAVLSLALLAATPGCAERRAAARPEPAAAQEPAPRAAAEPAEAKAILLRMAEFLARTPRFSVKLEGGYDVVQASGQKIEFGENRTVTVSRPDGLRVEVEHGDGEQHLVLYDGREITVYSPSQNVYAQATKPGGIDAAVRYFLRDLGMRLPLAILLTSRFPEEIERRTQALDYVEPARILGKPAHHLAGRTETVDYQVWVAAGDRPLPLRVVLTYKDAVGQPQFRAEFSDWNLAPDIRDAQFAFTPPDGARKIAFLAQLPRIALKGPEPPEPTGGRK